MSKPLTSLTDSFLSHNGDSRALFLSQIPLPAESFEAEFRLDSEFIFRRSVLETPATEARVALYAPSFALIRSLQHRNQTLENLSWRQFEQLIASLLEADGYTIELMRGTKDGGVDVVALKDLGPTGMFKCIWQAKKLGIARKVDISVVRELADTRREVGASKAMIVTSTYLTKGALDRIQRDRYILGKVDRDDLNRWVKRVLRG